MNKLLYVGCYRDGTGWAQAAIDYILCLDAAGVHVVPRAFKLNNHEAKLPDRLLELEARSSSGCDAVIQHVLPRDMDRNGRMINVGVFASETSHFRSSGWSERLNTMDRNIVFCRQQVDACRESGVSRPVAVVPHATDVTRFQRSHAPLDALAHLKENGKFVFYTIGEFVRRKNLGAVLQAFHLEFSPDEPVELVVKTSVPGLGPDEAFKVVSEYCTKMKQGLRLHGGKPELYKRELVVTDRLTPQGLMRLHAAGDVFVQASRGEAWSIPAFDAMAMGKTPIVTAGTGYCDYLSNESGWLVPARPEPAFGADDALPGLYTGDETWLSVDVLALRACMRQAYEQESVRTAKARVGVARAYDFSYEAVGPRLRKAVYDAEVHPIAPPTRGAASLV